MSDLQLFDFTGQQVRVLQDEAGEPWFVAADVARILGYGVAKDMTRRLDEDEKGGRLVPTLGGEQEMLTISEAGLYGVILQRQTGRIPDQGLRECIARFKRWVTHEVLPSIRRTGGYAVPQPRQEPALPGSYLEALKELVSTVERAETAELQAATAQARVVELEPLAEVAETMISSDGDLSVADAAKNLARGGIDTGRNRLMRYLREIKWVDRTGHPYQAQIEAGRLAVKVGVYDHPHTGEPTISTTTRITGKGLAELRQRLAGSGTG